MFSGLLNFLGFCGFDDLWLSRGLTVLGFGLVACFDFRILVCCLSLGGLTTRVFYKGLNLCFDVGVDFWWFGSCLVVGGAMQTPLG